MDWESEAPLAPVLRAQLRARDVVLAALLCAVGCGGDPAPTPPASAPDAPARRVVSLVPALTETVVALGASERLVAIGRYDPEVPGRAGLPRLGDALSVSLESVAALSPDLALANGVGLAERLAPLDPPTRVLLLPTDRVADVLAATRRLGALLECDDAAARLVRTLEDALAAARARSAARAAPSPLVLVVVQRRPIYTAGAGSYLHELLEAVGARNAAADLDAAWPVLSEESVVARAPDVVLDASVGDVDTAEGRAAVRAAWDVLATVPAVRDGRVLVLGPEAEPLFRAGPRLPEALRLLEALLYGAETPR